MGVGSKGRAPPRIFIHGTDIVDRGLIVLFFGLFSVGPPGNFSVNYPRLSCVARVDGPPWAAR